MILICRPAWLIDCIVVYCMSITFFASLGESMLVELFPVMTRLGYEMTDS